ncbi:hypothetical protein FKP32DRAFT_1600661 [Trametes sanguinea]|nr:hypothetical protein FKP32DRAFT_1600653 [Trametes sanguinea]KAI9068214.1 hypothetical protein FKP32DRAFT_1600661 [Trametes sanguinea]
MYRPTTSANSSASSSLPYERHPTYYLPDGSICLLLQKDCILYRVFSSVLMRASGTFETLLSLKAEDPEEGKKDSNPIVLPGIERREFDFLMAYMIDNEFPEANEEGLIALLNLTTFFEMDRHKARVKAAILRLTEFRPGLQYHLGIKNAIPEWTEAGFRRLVAAPLDTVTWTDIERMGLEAFTSVVRTKHEIDKHRRLVAFWPPNPVFAPSCSINMRCEISWKREWWGVVAKHLLHPEDGLAGAELVEALQGAEVVGMCYACKDLTVASVSESGVLTREDVLIADVIRDMLP